MSSDQPPADRPAGQSRPGLRRRTGLTRGGPPARTTGLAVNPARYDPARRAARTTLRAVSDATARYNRDVRSPVVTRIITARRVYAAEHGEPVCEAAGRIAAAGYADPVGGCRGPLDGHEIVRRGQRGDTAHTGGGVIALCRAHNSWAASDYDLAVRLGLVIRYWSPEATPFLLPMKPRPGDHLPPAA